MRLDVDTWSALEYDETDRVSVVRYLGSLGCRADEALSNAAIFQQPLTPELTKSLIDAGASDKDALSLAAECQCPLTPELAKLLIDARAFGKNVLSDAALYQSPLTLELAKLLIDTGRDPAARDDDGWDALVFLAYGGHPADPQVTDLLLSAGYRTDLDGYRFAGEKHRLRFNQILKEHAEWKENLNRMSAEHSPTDAFYGLNWGR